MPNKSKNDVPTEKKVRIEYNLLKDEIEWVKEKTRFYDRFIPVLSNKLFLKIFFSIVFLGLVLIKFFPIFITFVFSLITSYIKFKRTKFGFGIEVEPNYLFSIVLMLAFGYQYGLFFILIPVAIPFMITGPGAVTFINIWNKLVVFVGVYFFHYFFPTNKLIVWVAVGLVLITDLLGYSFRKKFGQLQSEILLTIISNTGLRFVYLTFFLDIFVNWLYV